MSNSGPLFPYPNELLSGSGIGRPSMWRLMFMGDSNTAGSNGAYTGMVGSWPSYCVQFLRTLRSDFDVIASQAQLFEGCAGSSLPLNEGHPGFTIAQLGNGYAGYCTAAGGAPDILVGDMAGTNDIATGRTLAQMQADTLTTLKSVWSRNPNTIILWMGPPPFTAGTTPGGNLAAWNAQRTAYLGFLNQLAQQYPNLFVSNASQLVGNGDIQVDGVHLNQGGSSTIGTDIARQLHAIMGVPANTLDIIPRSFRTRQPWGSYQLATTGTDALTCTGHAGFNPGSGAFTIAVDFYPTSLAAGNGTIVNYGAYGGSNNMFTVLRNGAALRLYWMGPAGTIASGTNGTFAETPGLVLNKWHRIVVMADPVTQRVAMYVNGQLAGLATGVAAWTSTQQVLTLGKEGVFTAGAIGYYSRVYAAQAVPGPPGQMAALLAVERDYYLGQSLCPGAGSASFSLDATLADDVYAPGQPNPSFVLVGAAASVAAYPGGTPVRPWEQQNIGPGM